MRERLIRGSLYCATIAVLALCMGPSSASADSYTFFKIGTLTPHGGAGEVGPAAPYPSSLAISGLSGTVTNVRVTIIGYTSSSPQDTDIVITGPNGQKVMLMSDACGRGDLVQPPDVRIQNDNWTFDDSAQTYLSRDGPCFSAQDASFKPSDYLNVSAEAAENPDMSSCIMPPGCAGGPPPPYVNALSSFNGASPNGAWNLFVLDDYAGCCVGFYINGWALTLDVQPPPPAQATATALAPGPTGQQAAALKKCKKKQGRARRKCKKKAFKLPL
jgi:hypothetical protein